MSYLKRLYKWVLHWADTPYGSPALFVLAVAESSFFPIPPDVLLMALCLSISKKSFKYAALCTAGSVIGGAIGYVIGMEFWELGKDILFKYIDPAGFEAVKGSFEQHGALYVFVAGFTPIPYKVFTISAGFFGVNFPVFVLASVASRGARFFLVAGFIYLFGPPIKEFIDKYFNILTIAFTVLLIGGFLLLKYLL